MPKKQKKQASIRNAQVIDTYVYIYILKKKNGNKTAVFNYTCDPLWGNIMNDIFL